VSKLRQYGGLIAIVGIVIALDQYTKWLVRESLALGATWLPTGMEWLAPYARIVHWYNTGAAFGIFQGMGIVFALLAFVVIGVILYYYPQVPQEDWWLRLAMSLQLAGALGNLIDRLLHGWRVTDFVSVGNFPVWNVADASITVGTIILLLGLFWKEIIQKPKPGIADTSSDTEEHGSGGNEPPVALELQSKEGSGE
jgi:signal peptidase II